MLHPLLPMIGFAWSTRVLDFLFLAMAIPTNLFIKARLPRATKPQANSGSVSFQEYQLYPLHSIARAAKASASCADPVGSKDLHVLADTVGADFLASLGPSSDPAELGNSLHQRAPGRSRPMPLQPQQ